MIRVQPAPLRFIIGNRVFFVRACSEAGPAAAVAAEWLVPHILKEITPAARGVAAVSRYRPYANGDEILEAAPAAAAQAVMDAMDHQGDAQRVRVGQHVQLPEAGRVYTVGELYLRSIGERAENLDYKFALRMQGLQNATLKSVWVCSDPDLGGDRRDDLGKSFTEMFIREFLSYTRVDPTGRGGGAQTDAAMREAVHLFDEMTSIWVESHRNGLSPHIVASAESLVGLFFGTGLRWFSAGGYTWGDVARYLMRDPVFAPHFGLCLHYYMTKMDQDRGGRNASYKAMFNATSGNLMALNAMNGFLTANRDRLQTVANRPLSDVERLFDVGVVDWYGLVMQLHPQRKMYAYTRDFPD